MTYLMQTSDKRPDRAIDAAIRATIAEAEVLFAPEKFTGAWSTSGLGITNLGSRHVAFSNQASGLQGAVAGSLAWGVTAVTASTYTNWISLNIDDRAFQVIIGGYNRTTAPNITTTKHFANGQDLPRVDWEEIYTWREPKFYFQKPYVVTPANQHQVQVVSPVTLAGVPSEQIALLGYVIGRRAYLIATS